MSPYATFALLLCLVVTANNAAVCPNLRSAANFTVIAASTITNTGPTVINGNLAISPGTALTGFPPGVINGDRELATAVAREAQKDATAAYNYIKGLAYTADKTGVDLAGQILTPGVYYFSAAAGISAGGILTLNGAGTYIFQVGSTLITGANVKVVAKNGARARCIFWQVGSSVTFGANNQFLGNILAYASFTFGDNVTYHGGAYAQTAAITFTGGSHLTGVTSCRC